MILQVFRREFHDMSTIGDFFINGAKFCDSLEDTDRGLTSDMTLIDVLAKKVYGRTAIPYGTYPVTITDSLRFKRPMPLISKVTGFYGIRIHSGNTDGDTEGCILLGVQTGDDFVAHSRDTFNEFFDQLKAALSNNETCTLEVTKL